ncbi:MAG TPA: methyltransferase domain-containing protein [Candidatus Acidoferrum sp.]|nr:methyltransferase domain-containing protein [Candidatus Acidoferrum sp.]
MADSTTTIRTSIDLGMAPREAFDAIVQELAMALERQGIRFQPGPEGQVVQRDFNIGGVRAWKPGEHFALEWKLAAWEPSEVTEIEFVFESIAAGTRVTINHQGWGKLIGESREMAGWFASEIAAPLLRATSPEAFGDWITDRRARRPSGAQSREIYRHPIYHFPNFRVILSELALKPADYLLEVGCGGGALLKDALRSGCKAAAVDHSADMVQLAREANRDAINTGKLTILEAGADRLPFPAETFTCATMTGVLGFLADPVAALAEVHRVLQAGGRFVALGSDPQLRGTPAAPEPIASRLHFYNDDELGNLARRAGFGDVRVVRRDMEAFAREAGVPSEALPLFAGPGGPFLLARKR